MKSGLGYTFVGQNVQDFDISPKLGSLNGISYLYRGKKRFSFSTEINRNNKRFERTYFRSSIFAFITEDISVKYISIPLKVGYSIIGKSKLDVNLGLVLDYSYGVTHKFESDVEIPAQPIAGDLGQEYAALADVGVNVFSFTNSEIYSRISFQKSIGNIFDFSPRSSFPRKIFTYNVSVGYRLRV